MFSICGISPSGAHLLQLGILLRGCCLVTFGQEATICRDRHRLLLICRTHRKQCCDPSWQRSDLYLGNQRCRTICTLMPEWFMFNIHLSRSDIATFHSEVSRLCFETAAQVSWREKTRGKKYRDAVCRPALCFTKCPRGGVESVGTEEDVRESRRRGKCCSRFSSN